MVLHFLQDTTKDIYEMQLQSTLNIIPTKVVNVTKNCYLAIVTMKRLLPFITNRLVQQSPIGPKLLQAFVRGMIEPYEAMADLTNFSPLQMCILALL